MARPLRRSSTAGRGRRGDSEIAARQEPRQGTGARPGIRVEPGVPLPLGANCDPRGVNFSVFSLNSIGMQLLLFDRRDAPAPALTIDLDPARHRTYQLWHCRVEGVGPGWFYAYRASGPSDTAISGHAFDPGKVLVDPYARGNSQDLWVRANARVPGDNLATSMRSAIVDTSGYDWEDDAPPRHSLADTIIYEVHVRGFTRSPSSGCSAPGTFAGFAEKIPYLRELGVTAVELLPVFEFDERDIDWPNPLDGSRLINFWGYNPVCFFAPHPGFCRSGDEAARIREFRDMVKALHRAGIEVILDVVYNHTSESDHTGPTISLRGLDNSVYYHLNPARKDRYRDFSGCGNAVNCNHPVVQKLVIDSLEFWVREMHVDGFRFDLASLLARGTDGEPMDHPPLLGQIELSEALRGTKIIAEAWDAAGLYQVGRFPGLRWAEWNDKFRDDVRRFVRGDGGMARALAYRVMGSPDLYESRRQLPANSINYVTVHDGFTLRDLVSYNARHNLANGQANKDGADQNYSLNYGAEGETTDPSINAVRARQVRNMLAVVMLSQGVPMVLAGDEAGRTQRGNNNAYCQDNETSWFDWGLVETNRDLLRFTKLLIAFRKRHASLRRAWFVTGETNERGLSDISWHAARLGTDPFVNERRRVLSFTLAGFDGEPDLHVMLNMGEGERRFQLPFVPGRAWRRAIDTSLAPPHDISEPGEEPEVAGHCYQVAGRTVVALVSAAAFI